MGRNISRHIGFRILFALGLLTANGLFATLAAQLNAELKIAPTLDSVRVGQPLDVQVQLTLPANGSCNGIQIHPDSIRVILRSLDFKDTSEVSFEIIDYGLWERAQEYNFLPRHLKWAPQQNGSNQIFANNLKIIVWEPGTFEFPAAKAEVTLSNGNYEVFSEKFIFKIGETDISNISQVDSSGMAPIKTIEREGKKSYLGLIAGMIGAAILITVFLVWFANRKGKGVDYVPPPILAHETALTALSAIEKRKDWEKGLLKKYYDELTLVIRKYLEDRYEIKALESTTDEIIGDLADVNIPDEIRQELKKLLPMTDMVKFAKADPSGESHVAWLDWAKDMVEITKEEPKLEKENPSQD